jgi:hypothetical protein
VTTGIAFPLGNFHNVGPHDTLAAEYVHRDDLETGAALILAAAEALAAGPQPEPAAERLAQRAAAFGPRLRATAATWKIG